MENEFEKLGLNDKVLKSIKKLNYEKPSEIQEKMIPLIMKGIDLIGQAETGTGKTLAYAASILSKIDVNDNRVKAIILTPTRELALQVCEEFTGLNYSSNFDILAVYGGSSIENQIDVVANNNDKLPTAWPEHILLLIVALMLWGGVFLYNFKRS